MHLRSVAILLGASLLAACADPKVPLAEGPREYAPTDYEIVLDRWTRSDNLVTATELDNVLSVTATYESWDFRWAYAVSYTHLRAHETVLDLVCRLLLEKKKQQTHTTVTS